MGFAHPVNMLDESLPKRQSVVAKELTPRNLVCYGFFFGKTYNFDFYSERFFERQFAVVVNS